MRVIADICTSKMEENNKQNEVTVLTDIPTGSSCIISKVHGHGGFRHRIMEMGFIKGEKVDVIKNAPLMDPIEYSIMGSHVSLRRSEADKIPTAARHPSSTLPQACARRWATIQE